MKSLTSIKQLLFGGLLGVSLLLSSCSQDNNANAIRNGGTEASAENSAEASKVKEIFYTIPSPVEMVSLIKQSGARYDHTMLNDVRHLNRYTSAKDKALNLGIYGADLSYTSVFNQNQESIIYLSCAKQLADELGVSSAFGDEIMERVEENLEDRDSLLHIISETFYVLDSYLKENKRSNISAQIITGGWVEGLFLSSRIIESKGKQEDLVNRLIDQKFALNDLIALNKSYNKDGSLDSMVGDLEKLKAVYDRTQEIESVADSEGSGDTVVLGGGKKLTMSDADVDEIVILAKEIRMRYIQG